MQVGFEFPPTDWNSSVSVLSLIIVARDGFAVVRATGDNKASREKARCLVMLLASASGVVENIASACSLASSRHVRI